MLKDAETGQRGFLLTGRDEYLQPYRDAAALIPKTFTELADLTAKEPEQARRVAAIRAVVQQKLAELQQTIDLRRSQGGQAALAVVMTDEGKIMMDQIRQICAEIDSVEDARFVRQSEQMQARSNRVGLVGTLGGGLLFVLLAIATGTIQRGTHRRLKLIAELAESEAQVKQARDWFQTTLGSIGDAVIATDSSGNITFLNGVAESLTGWSQEEALGLPLDQVFVISNEDTGATVESPVSKVLRDGTVVGLANHTKLTRRDGSSVSIDDSATPIRDSTGKISGVVLVFRDINERKLADSRLRRSEERLRFMAESMPQKIFTATSTGDVDYLNAQWIQFTGLSFEQIRHWGWTRFIHPDDLDENLRLWKHSIETGEPFQFTHRFRRADGAYRWHLTRAHAMRDSSGKISMWIGSNTEIHDQKEIEAELRRANEDLQQYAFAASHDLQEPLRMITSYSQMLVRGYRGHLDGDASMCVGYIIEGTQRMRDLLGDLLEYTHVTADHQAPLESVDLNPAVQRAVENCKPALEECDGSVACELLPVVIGRETHFLQLFQNLISNAIKYRSDQPPRIQISAVSRDDMWRFAVSDNGIGIDAEYHQKIFGLFKRLHGKSTPGTGIGLAICQRVVESYGGRIWVESQVNQGSTFLFTLPGAARNNS